VPAFNLCLLAIVVWLAKGLPIILTVSKQLLVAMMRDDVVDQSSSGYLAITFAHHTQRMVA
jgi:hypothetical protein